MKLNDKIRFTECLVGLCTLYGKQINTFLLEIYWQACAKFELADVQRALHAHINNPDQGQFMPKPADIVRYLQGSGGAQALRAWSLVLQAMQGVGCYSSVVFDDVIIHAVITEMSGWVHLCKTQADELPYKAREFERRYASYVLQPPQTYPAVLTGIIEWQNKAQGYHYGDNPILVGDMAKARLVYQGGTLLGSLHYPPTPTTNH